MSILAPSPAQRPKLIEAIQSLRLVEALQETRFQHHARSLTGFVTANGLITKLGKNRTTFNNVKTSAEIAAVVENPHTPFNFSLLSSQILNECVEENGDRWKDIPHAFAQGWCQPLISKINILTFSAAWTPVFGPKGPPSVFSELEKFFKNDQKLLRINLSDLSFDFHLREIAVNLIGRWLREYVRDYKFVGGHPALIFLDEAHNFLNRHLGEEDFKQSLDAFEKIAKEGRKFWLNLVLATQQPRDIPPGILSQMGTLIVHRLINEADRKVVETACGQLDAAAAKFLPSLGPGQVAIIGVDFPIPLTIQIEQPPKNLRPTSEGPKFSNWWKPISSRAAVPHKALPAVVVQVNVIDDDDDIPF